MRPVIAAAAAPVIPVSTLAALPPQPASAPAPGATLSQDDGR